MTLQALLVKYRRELHKHPELSLEEYETTERLRNWLQEHHIFCYELGFTPGIVAEVRGELPGPTVALRADIDALPIEDASGAEFSSVNEGVAHCCGHDTHMAIMLGAAILLQERKAQLRGNVRFIFQPGEESSNGAGWFSEKYPAMFKDVKAIFGAHNKPELPVGTVGIRPGPLMASVDKFTIEITGKGGHGGMPELCLDPIVAGAQLINSLQSIVSRSLSPLENAVVSITQFHAGNTWNVIPETAFMEGTVRTFQESAREKIPVLMERICQGIGATTSTAIDFKWEPGINVVNNSDKYTALLTRSAEKVGLKAIEPQQNLGGEDFSHFLSIVPGFFVYLGSEGPYQWHHPSYTINEDFLEPSARYFAQVAEDFLNTEQE